jgi:hypothetical protein
MGNLLRWLQPDSEYGWTDTMIFRATSRDGTYSQIFIQPISDTVYHDLSGTCDHWYKLAFYNSVGGAQSTFTEPLQAEHFQGYATIEEVRSFCRVTNKEFDDSTIQTMIDRATDRIDDETARTWLGFVRKDVFIDGDDSDICWLPNTDINNVLVVEIDESYSGTYTTILVKDILDGIIDSAAVQLKVEDADDFPDSGTIQIDDELITYTSKNGNDLLGLTRGTGGTTAAPHANESIVWLGDSKPMIRLYNEGYIILTKDSQVTRFVANPQSVRVKYITGNNKIPANIKHLCLLMVSQMMNIEDPRTEEIDRVIAEQKWKGPIGLT